ncbi:MAG: chorismate synthase [Vicingaceae bacterium]
MSGNSFGRVFKLTSFGESHGPAIGGIIEGCPAGIVIDQDFVQAELDKRRPGGTAIGTKRKEEDKIEFLSGIFEGMSTGTPIGFIIKNKDSASSDYNALIDVYRPSHADYTYESKYGMRDHRGGGRSSARETATRVAAGAIAKLLLQGEGISVHAYVSSVGDCVLKKFYTELDLSLTYESPVRCPDKHLESFMMNHIDKVQKDGDSVGGTITGVVKGLPSGLGEPVFDKLQAVLAHAVMSINAVKGFEYGSGFASSAMRGSAHNDEMYSEGGKIKFRTNYSGGVQGGISNGADIYFKAAFKPVASIAKEQATVNKKGEKAILGIKGRHDPCVVPRAVAIVESMTAMVMADFLLLSRLNKR